MEKNELNLQNVPEKKSGQADTGGRFSTALDFFFLAPLGFISVPFLYYFLIISPSVFI